MSQENLRSDAQPTVDGLAGQGTTTDASTSPAKKPYETPVIESSEVFESFTLQSCNQFPNECGGALE